jgi:type II secretory pathway component PulC
MRKEKATNRQGTNEVGQNAASYGVAVDRQNGPDRSILAQTPYACACSGVNLKAIAVAILVIVAVSCIGQELGQDEEQVLAFDEYLIIPERNMFSSRRQASGAVQKVKRKPRVAATTVPEGIEVIGIVKTSDALVSIVIIKDHGRHVPCRVGDRVGGMVITDIRTSEIFFESPEGTRIAKIQPGKASDRPSMPKHQRAVPGPVPTRVAVASLSGRRVPIRAREVRHLASQLPLVTHVEDGRVRGLRLTQDIMGLREGDRVTHVGGQSLHTKYAKQKLLQITRKYRQYGKEMPEIPVVVERDNRKLELVLVPTS